MMEILEEVRRSPCDLTQGRGGARNRNTPNLGKPRLPQPLPPITLARLLLEPAARTRRHREFQWNPCRPHTASFANLLLRSASTYDRRFRSDRPAAARA